MKLSTFLSTALLSTAAVADSSGNATIEIVGNKFFYSNNGSQFYIKGIAYQQSSASTTNSSFTDPLADEDSCKRDLPYLLQLSTNVLRVYAVDSTKDHSACMNLFAENGIYVIADLSEPDLSINRDSPSWDLSLYDRYTSVVDAMAGYSNVLGFFAGNEVTNLLNNTDADAYVKAAVRDTKAYMSEKGLRAVPVGYSAADVAEIRIPEAQYFACGNASDGVDFYGINMYEWCGSSSFQSSGYQNATQNFENLGVPIFFSEYGCNAVQPRKFEEVGTLYGDDMTGVWSGGIVYMYFEEENNYGLVTLSGSSVSTLQDFGYLSSALATISPSSTASSDVSTVTRTSCPTVGAGWDSSTDLPPTPNRGICECISDGASCRLASGVDAESYSDIFDYICGSGTVSCDGINGNATTGEYGAFVGCDDESKLNYMLNLYYSANGKSSGACDFSGSATLVSASAASGCAAVLSEAGTAGTGAVTASVSATGSATKVNSAASGTAAAASSGSGAASGSASASGSESKSSKSSNGAAANIQVAGTLLGSIALVFLGAL